MILMPDAETAVPESIMRFPFKISDDLKISVGTGEVRLTPSQGLAFAERLARASFRRALAEEAETPPSRVSKPAAKRRVS